jgi:hypothetical protein
LPKIECVEYQVDATGTLTTVSLCFALIESIVLGIALVLFSPLQIFFLGGFSNRLFGFPRTFKIDQKSNPYLSLCRLSTMILFCARPSGFTDEALRYEAGSLQQSVAEEDS